MKQLFTAAILAASFTTTSFAVNIDAGESVFNSTGCAGCHGAGGKSTMSFYPALNGLDSDYIIKQLKDFQSGARSNPTMNAMAPMVAGHEEDIAAFLFSQ